MKTFTQFITEAKVKDESFLKTIAKMKENVFVFIMGGSATGKNYLHNERLGSFPLVDIDEFTKQLTKGDNTLRNKFLNASIKMVGNAIDEKLAAGESFVQTGTGANIEGQLKRFRKAKDAGFTVIVVLAETTVEKAIERNKMRVGSGGHGIGVTAEKIQWSRERAAQNFEELKKSPLVDYAVKVET